jgi:hypothetical protein
MEASRGARQVDAEGKMILALVQPRPTWGSAGGRAQQLLDQAKIRENSTGALPPGPEDGRKRRSGIDPTTERHSPVRIPSPKL